MIPYSRPKRSDLYTLSQSKLLENHTSPHVRESRTFLDSGFHAVDSGFQKGLDSNFYCFRAFLYISFSCSNLAKLKDVVRMHNKFVFFFDL